MTDPKEKGKPIVPTRTPKKKTPGIFDNLRKIPQPHPVEEMLGLVSSEEATPPRPSTPSSTPTPSRGGSTTDRSAQELRRDIASIAPQRDYTKVANSIVREAIPSGAFGGKSKQLYDYLYSLTRGAIVPRRTVRISKDKLMKGAGIGSDVTLRTNLAKLSNSQLIIERIYAGTHGGNEYEVFLPEEVSETGATPSTPSTASTASSSSQFREALEAVETTPSSTSLSPIKSESSEENKTLFKTSTENDDDAALAGLVTTLKDAAKQVTGKELSVGERDRWRELAEVLATELKIAATRTTVSSAPAFLSEHLRRRLWKKDKQQLSEEGRADAGSTKPTKLNMDISKCPDCGGSGMFYPDGYEKGVVKCGHERLEEGN
jgi:hypothetical protein